MRLLTPLLLCAFTALAQLPAASVLVAQHGDAAVNHAGDTQEKDHAWSFEVVSIRQNKSGGHQSYGPTADGFHMENFVFLLPIIGAYPPHSGSALYSPDQVEGFPEWTVTEHYDVDAKVAAEDLTAWGDPKRQPEMLRAMLKAMLADRLKLAAHSDEKEVSVYSLVVGKNGPKFSESKLGEPHPKGMKFPGGAVLVPEQGGQVEHFYGITIPTLSSILSTMAGRAVQDNTGLKGVYDVAIHKAARLDAAPSASGDDDEPSLFTVLEEIGLKLVSTKGKVEVLKIDHIERPSPN